MLSTTAILFESVMSSAYELHDQLLKSVRAAQVEQVKNTMARAFEAHLKSNEDALRELPETIFVERFLPLFAGEIEDNDERQIRLQEWDAVAGTRFRGVRIIDHRRAVLFTVPALYSSSIAVKSQSRATSFEAIHEQADQQARFGPISRQLFEAKAMDMKARELLQGMTYPPAELNAWRAVFQRYGKKPPGADFETVEPDAQPTGSLDDYFD